MKTTISLCWIVELCLFSIGLAWAAKDAPAKKYLLYVGTYTKGESRGIYAYRFDPKSGTAASLGLAAETENPSFLAVDPGQKFLYAVNELTRYKGAASGAVTAFAIDPATGKLSALNQVASRGADPCYIAFDQTGNYVLVANYTGGEPGHIPGLQRGPSRGGHRLCPARWCGSESGAPGKSARALDRDQR